MATGEADLGAYDRVHLCADWLLQACGEQRRPEVGIICGSGLGALSLNLEDAVTFPYESVPHFPISTVEGHAGCLVFGRLRGRRTVVMQGRTHYYEGYAMDRVTLPVRVARRLGIHTLIITNAAGALNPAFNIGEMVIVNDHISLAGLAGCHPLVGPNDERMGIRFPAMSNAYDRDLRQGAAQAAERLGLKHLVHARGTYCFVCGPSYETAAEARFLRQIGGDCVGMSTVPEVIVARHEGLRVLVISVIANKCVMDPDSVVVANHREVLAASERRASELEQLVSEVISVAPAPSPAAV